MSAMWNHGAAAPRRSVNPPPVCFNCNEQGHFVVNCPKPSRLNTGAFPAPPVQQHQAQLAQTYHHQPGPLQSQHYPQAHYPPQQQNLQFAHPPQQPYGQAPAPQPYNAPQIVGQYSRPGYQPPPYNQYTTQTASQQYGTPGFQAPPQGYAHSAKNVYQPPPANFPPQTNGYAHNYGQNHTSHPPPQWNHASQPPRSAPPYQRQQRSISQASQFGFPGIPPHQPFQQNPQQQLQMPEIYGNTPQTPASTTSNQPSHNRPSRSSSANMPDFNTLNHAGTPRLRSQSLMSTIEREIKLEDPVNNSALHCSPENREETPEPLNEDQQFDWDLKKIFSEPRQVEFVALAQPLATSFEVTPVPHIDTRSKKSVSRLARNDNQKEFIISIRSAAHWSFAQEDPIFADLNLDSPLIPIENVAAWIAKRHGIPEIIENVVLEETSRKRAWSHEQDDVDNQQERHDGTVESSSNKRRKNSLSDESNKHMTDGALHHDGNVIPVLDRGRTPCVGFADDVWAPEPGEVGSVSSPADPTEALLASLGVTGEAKPTNSEILPPFVPLDEQSDTPDVQEPCQAQLDQAPPNSIPQHQQIALEDQHQEFLQSQTPQNVAPAGAPHEPPQNAQYQYQAPFPPQQQGFGPHRSASWSNDPPNQPKNSAPTGDYQPIGVPLPPHYYPGPPAPAPNHPQRSASYPNPQYGQPQYPNNTPAPISQNGYANGPVQNGQFNGQPQYINGQTPQGQYAGPQYPNPQYPNPTHQGPPQWGNEPPQHTYTQYNPQHPNALPMQQSYSNILQEPPQYNNGHPNHHAYNNPQGAPPYPAPPVNQQSNGYFPQEQPQYNSMPSSHLPNQPPFNNYQLGPEQNGFIQNQQSFHGPSRQDSGYMSARGSYSNGSGDTDHPQAAHHSKHGNVHVDDSGKENQNLSPPQSRLEEQAGGDEPLDSESEAGTPLSPTSAEILGKLEPDHKRKATSRQNGVKKPKRPQPIVAEAYSRRW